MTDFFAAGLATADFLLLTGFAADFLAAISTPEPALEGLKGRGIIPTVAGLYSDLPDFTKPRLNQGNWTGGEALQPGATCWATTVV